MREGTVVISRAGRDKDTTLVVLKLEGDFAFVADGKQRPLERPKKKRIKHLAVTNKRLEACSYSTNNKLKRALCNSHLPIKEELDLG